MARSVMQMRAISPALWEDAIERRGQHVLWYSAASCFCVSDNGRVDPNCSSCYGKGFIYRPVRSTRRIITGVAEGAAVIDISAKGVQIGSILRLYTGVATEAQVQSFTPTTFTPVVRIPKGTRYTLDFVETFVQSYVGVASYIGRGIIDVPIRVSNNQNYFAGSIVSVVSARNVTKDRPLIVKKFWANKILTSSNVAEDDELLVEVEYVRASKFLVTSVNPKSKIEGNIVLQDADAMMAFPGTFHIGRGDIIVLQLAEAKETIVGYNEGPTYVFPYQSIARILSVEDKHGEIRDFTLVNDNEILWGSRVPDRFSCAFTYHPAFSVLADLPNLRYSEDKIFPKRVFLKKFGTFSHPSKVLSLEPANIEETGLLDDPMKADEGGLIW